MQKMKKVLVIEDEFREVQVAFEYVNDLCLNSELEIINVAKSQDVDFTKISEYDYVFLDITLAKKSQMDGYGILKKIERENIPIQKLVIMTGNGKISDVLKERGITNDYPKLIKPLDYQELKSIFSE